jgi:hypothetical protein
LQSRLSRVRARISGRYALATALILALGIPSAAIGFGEGRSVLGGKRNPSSDATKAFSAETEIIANNSTYGTRQSNKRNGDGGGAIYGCRSNEGNEPCVKSFNLNNGRAFDFQTNGNLGGRIQTKDASGAPFTTNATGVATGLNSDKVDGKDATDFAASGDLRFADVAANGTLGNNRGAASASVADATNTYTVTFDKDVSKCSFTATSNVTDADADAVAIAVSASTSDPKAVVVDEANAPAAGTPFHLQVIC